MSIHEQKPQGHRAPEQIKAELDVLYKEFPEEAEYFEGFLFSGVPYLRKKEGKLLDELSAARDAQDSASGK